MRKRVMWKPEELQAVIEHACTFGPPESGDSEEIWRRAQEILPTERRRPFDPRTMAMLNQQRRALKNSKSAKKAEPVKPEPPPQQPEAAALEKVEVMTSPLTPFVDSAVETILEIASRVLYDAKLRLAIRDLIKEAVAPETEEKIETGVLWRAPIAGKEQRRRIVIAAGGMRANMVAEALRPLMRFYDFRFWNSRDEHPARLRQILEGAEVAVMSTSSMSHGGAEMCKAWSRAGKGKLINYNKSINLLTEELPALIGDEVGVTPKAAP